MFCYYSLKYSANNGERRNSHSIYGGERMNFRSTLDKERRNLPRKNVQRGVFLANAVLWLIKTNHFSNNKYQSVKIFYT